MQRTEEFTTLMRFSIAFLLLSMVGWLPVIEMTDLIRTGLMAVLCGFILMGHNWARITMLVILGLSLFLGVVSLLTIGAMKTSELDNVMVTALGLLVNCIVYVWFGFLLISQKIILGHFKKDKTQP